MNRDAMDPAYDDAAEASGWYGPEVVFGLSYKFVRPGQTVLDIGIGTGLGSVLFRKAGLKIHGMDNSQQMLDACREKGFTSLRRHDLGKTPLSVSRCFYVFSPVRDIRYTAATNLDLTLPLSA